MLTHGYNAFLQLLSVACAFEFDLADVLRGLDHGILDVLQGIQVVNHSLSSLGSLDRVLRQNVGVGTHQLTAELVGSVSQLDGGAFLFKAKADCKARFHSGTTTSRSVWNFSTKARCVCMRRS